ncbi:MAG: FAD-dependent oxidoreductase [Clostridiales bacterium]|nr:FAD-dependent oxidoreductase [Clostridiales bacterium]
MKKIETDVVVVAAGLSGLAAAAAAAENGARVVAFEKANTVGGAANMGMGPLGIGTKQQKAMMVDIDVERAFKMFMDYTHWRVDANLVKRYFENSADTIEWLEDMGVEFAGAYKYFPKSEQTWHIVAVNGGIGRNGGAIMTKALMDYAKSNGAEFYLEAPVKKILKGSDGRICGVIAAGPDGEEIEAVCKAVIICTGGAGDNPEMIKERIGYTYREDMFNFAIPGLKGDGILMAEEVGAVRSEMNIEMIYILPNSDFGPDCVPAVFMQPNLLVNQFGERFIDEEQMQNTTFTGNAIAIQKGRVGYSILDSSILRGYIKNGPDVTNFVHHPESVADFDDVVTEYIKNGNPDVYKADSVRELAGMLGIDPDALEAAVDEYNEMCGSADTKFYKSRKFMKPIVKAPFYAGKFRPGAYGTLGGIKINTRAEVLDKDWNAIPGLYAAGTDTCAIYGDSYMFLLPGNTMGYCLNTGRFAGESAADYAARD